jgi:hypothetical protein
MADHPATEALSHAIPLVVIAAVTAGLLLLIAWVQAKATVYTVTTARVAMRVGAALTVTLNLPYSRIEAADLDLRKGGTGTIAFRTAGETRLSYLVLWPHVRPWHAKRTQPALRCIPEAERVARMIAEAVETRIDRPQVARRGAGNAVAAE